MKKFIPYTIIIFYCILHATYLQTAQQLTPKKSTFTTSTAFKPNKPKAVLTTPAIPKRQTSQKPLVSTRIPLAMHPDSLIQEIEDLVLNYSQAIKDSETLTSAVFKTLIQKYQIHTDAVEIIQNRIQNEIAAYPGIRSANIPSSPVLIKKTPSFDALANFIDTQIPFYAKSMSNLNEVGQIVYERTLNTFDIIGNANERILEDFIIKKIQDTIQALIESATLTTTAVVNVVSKKAPTIIELTKFIKEKILENYQFIKNLDDLKINVTNLVMQTYAITGNVEEARIKDFIKDRINVEVQKLQQPTPIAKTTTVNVAPAPQQPVQRMSATPQPAGIDFFALVDAIQAEGSASTSNPPQATTTFVNVAPTPKTIAPQSSVPTDLSDYDEIADILELQTKVLLRNPITLDDLKLALYNFVQRNDHLKKNFSSEMVTKVINEIITDLQTSVQTPQKQKAYINDGLFRKFIKTAVHSTPRDIQDPAVIKENVIRAVMQRYDIDNDPNRVALINFLESTITRAIEDREKLQQVQPRKP